MHKCGPKRFVLNWHVLELKPVKAYYRARQRILLSRLPKPPAVWIGGGKVARYMGYFFEQKTVRQSDGTESFGLSELVLRGRGNEKSKLHGLEMTHPSHVLYVHSSPFEKTLE